MPALSTEKVAFLSCECGWLGLALACMSILPSYTRCIHATSDAGTPARDDRRAARASNRHNTNHFANRSVGRWPCVACQPGGERHPVHSSLCFRCSAYSSAAFSRGAGFDRFCDPLPPCSVPSSEPKGSFNTDYSQCSLKSPLDLMVTGAPRAEQE